MSRTLSRMTAGAAVCAAALSFAPRTAHAYDVNGVAFGADVALGGPSGLALSIGLGRLELDFIVGMSLNLPEGGVLEPNLAAAGGVFFTVADGEQTNFQIGGRIGVLVVGNNGVSPFGEAELNTDAGISFEVDARVEHRFDDHCAINLQVGLAMQVWPDDPDFGNPQPDFVFGFGNSGLVGGAGFRYWFDGLGGGAPPVVQAAPARQERVAPVQQQQEAPPPAETGTTETPYWEQ